MKEGTQTGIYRAGFKCVITFFFFFKKGKKTKTGKKKRVLQSVPRTTQVGRTRELLSRTASLGAPSAHPGGFVARPSVLRWVGGKALSDEPEAV